MADTIPRITRDQLAKFLPDNDTIRRFEKLFLMAGTTTPQNIEIIFRLIEEVVVDAGNAEGKANQANSSIDSLSRDVALLASMAAPDTGRVDSIDNAVRSIEAYIGGIDAKANEAAEAVQFLSRLIEVASTSPQYVMPRSFPVDYLDFDQAPPYVGQTARVAWSTADDTLNIHHSGDVTQQVGQETYARINNNSGATIPNGAAVSFDPITDTYDLFIADGTLTPINIIGIATQEILNGESGRITVWGRVRDLDTTGTPVGETWSVGEILYTSPTVAGGLTNVKPTAPNISMPIARVRVVDATVGQVSVRPTIEQQLFYGQFSKTADQTPSAANTADAITWSSALIANGISIGAPTSRIVADNAGLYKFSASFQLTSSSAAVKNVWFWFRKNGTDIANSALITSMDSGTAIRAPSRSLLISLAAGDYVELMWASDSVNVTLDSVPATAFAPAAPAALLTVNQEQQ